MGNGEFYEQAIVPEHLTRLSIENLPLDEAFYISPGDKEDYEPPAIFVNHERKLMISREHDIDQDDIKPGTPVGLVGVMRTMVINSVTNKVTEHCIADLRFIEWHSLIDVSEVSQSMTDQESFMSFVDMVNEALQVDAFISLDVDYDFEVGKKIPKGTFYGSPELYPNLEQLQKRGSKLMKKFLEQRVSVQPKAAEQPVEVVEDPKKEAIEQKGTNILHKLFKQKGATVSDSHTSENTTKKVTPRHRKS